MRKNKSISELYVVEVDGAHHGIIHFRFALAPTLISRKKLCTAI